MSLSDVTISHEAWGDPRVAFLAQLASYADGIDTAIVRLARLWARCTSLGTDIVPAVEVNACLRRVDGAELLIAAGLGERVADGIRVKGRFANEGGKDRLGWRNGTEQRNVNGGRSRVAGAVRGPKGTFLAGPAQPPARPADSQPEEPASRIRLDQAGPASPADGQDQRSGSVREEEGACSGSGSASSDADPDLGGGRDDRDQVPAPLPLTRLGLLVNEFLRRVNEARNEIAASRDMRVRPVSLMDGGSSGERELRARLSASMDPERDLAQVLDVAIAEARQPPYELRWLSWSLASEKAWRTRLASTVNEASAMRAGPKRNPFGYAPARTDHPTSDEPVPFGEMLT